MAAPRARRRCHLFPTAARRRTRPPHDAAPPCRGPAFAPCCTTIRAPPLSACRAPAATLHLRTGASPTRRRLLTGRRVLLLRPLQPGRRAPLLRLPCAAAASTPPSSASPAACPSSAALPLLTGSKLRPLRPLAPPAAMLHLRAGATLLLLAGRELRKPPHSSCLICRDREGMR
ncbi:hypothetical protein PVAP13_1NG264319 [Panicum virgatum]|uniref:Uncharacterized protein n=1 Tax=Panicum virgatum TaxID=38727 RepID=A0A8T0X1A6_PANVG|nr:hypothetical protein PVAP13_1NG264319 [Panicum virgatum]